MLLILGFILAITSALLIAANFKLSSKPFFLLSLYLLVNASIVLISEIASLCSAIGPLFILSGHLILGILAGLIWLRNGRPAILGPFQDFKLDLRTAGSWVRQNPWLAILTLGIGIIYAIGAVLIMLVPPNNYDSLTYHLSRAAYWAQHGNLFPWPTPNFRQTAFPINSELGILWTFVLSGEDRWAGFVQWSAALASLLAIVGLARLIGANRSQAWFAGLCWAGLPQVLLQSVSTQNDLIVASYFVALVYFLFDWTQRGRWPAVWLSAVAFGLALGAKTTAILALPGLGLAGLLLWWQVGRAGLRRLLIWSAASLLGFLLFGSLTYVQNQIYYHNPIAPPVVSDASASGINFQWKSIAVHGLITLYQAVDPGSLPAWLGQPVDRARDWTTKKIVSMLQLPIEQNLALTNWTYTGFLNQGYALSEDVSWFGTLGFLLLTASCLIQGWTGIRQRDPVRIGLILLATAFFLVVSVTLAWSLYRGRYFILPVTLIAALLAFLYRTTAWRWQVVNAFLVSLLLCCGGYVLVQNPSKPLQGEKALWNLDRTSGQMVNVQSLEPIVRMVDRHVPSDARLATRLGEDDLDYPLFGPGLSRKIIQIDPGTSHVDMAKLAADFLLIEPRQRWFLQAPDGLRYLDQQDGWLLFAIDPAAKSSSLPTEVQQFIAGNVDPLKMFSVDERLAQKVGILWLWPLGWEIEQYKGQRFLWLGEGERQGMRGYIWSEQEQTATLELYLEPGPGRTDNHRTLRFIALQPVAFSYNKSQTVRENRSFDGPTTLKFSIQLQRGLNEFRLSMLDAATVHALPGGDTRPLLAALRRIHLSP